MNKTPSEQKKSSQNGLKLKKGFRIPNSSVLGRLSTIFISILSSYKEDYITLRYNLAYLGGK